MSSYPQTTHEMYIHRLPASRPFPLLSLRLINFVSLSSRLSASTRKLQVEFTLPVLVLALTLHLASVLVYNDTKDLLFRLIVVL
jgi:hypothetical protein